MTKSTFLKIARSYLLSLAIFCLLYLLISLVFKVGPLDFSRFSAGGILIVPLIRYTNYKFWVNLLITMAFSIVLGLAWTLVWPNGLALTTWQLLGLATAFAGLSVLTHLSLNKLSRR